MLRKETVRESTLELLKNLMQDDLLKEFYLVGGTALALQIGHRISIDLDLFSTDSFDVNDLLINLETQYSFQLDYLGKNTLKGEIDNVKVDFITHNYPLIKPLLVEEDGIRMASLEDIAAMKLNAIVVNGTRIKDFIDVAYLSTSLSLSEMINAYEAKYQLRNPALVIKSLDYHSDINFNERIQMVNIDYAWQDIEQRIQLMTLNPEERFPII